MVSKTSQSAQSQRNAALIVRAFAHASAQPSSDAVITTTARSYLSGPLTYFRVGRSLAQPGWAILNVASDLRMDDPPSNSSGSPAGGSVPKAVASRLSLYLRELQHLIEQGEETTSSSQLGRKLGFTDAQVRKDLAYFGHFGYPGIGYRCDKLVAAIRNILGTDQQWAAVLVGAGNLGRALLGYKGFSRQGFRVAAAFDTDGTKIGTQIEGVSVLHLDQLSDFARANRVRLGIIAVPTPAAQIVANHLVAAGIEGILNFAPVTIELPDTVQQVGVDLAIELEQLSFAIVSRAAEQGE